LQWKTDGFAFYIAMAFSTRILTQSERRIQEVEREREGKIP
jgi:hypothetical protein